MVILAFASTARYHAEGKITFQCSTQTAANIVSLEFGYPFKLVIIIIFRTPVDISFT